MTILFTVSLLLLIAFFATKIYEDKSGKRLFLSRLRSRADKVVIAKVRLLAQHGSNSYRRSCRFCNNCLSSMRYRLSEWLEGLARKLRQ